MSSDNLKTDQLTGSENEKTNLINEINQQIEDAITEFLSKEVTTDPEDLSNDECRRYLRYRLTGTPGADGDVRVTTDRKLYLVENAVTDGSILTFKTIAGSGIALVQGAKKILYCGGTNVIDVLANQALQTLCFGGSSIKTGTAFLELPGRVVGSATVGYVATRAGSIVGAGVNLEVTAQTTPGTIDLEVYVNGAAVFTVTVTISGTGVYVQSGVQGVGVDAVVAGQVVSCRLAYGTFVGSIDNSVAHVEIATSI